MKKVVLVGLGLSLLTGCSESAILAANGMSMVVAVGLLWSTVNIGRSS